MVFKLDKQASGTGCFRLSKTQSIPLVEVASSALLNISCCLYHYHEHLVADPLTSWPDAPSPSVAGESLVFVVFFCGMAVLCFVMFVHEDR